MKITNSAEGSELAEARQRQRQPGERRHGAQDLEDRIEAAHRPGALADQHAQRHADHGGKAEADADAAEALGDLPEGTLVDAAIVVERIDNEIPGIRPPPWSAAAARAPGSEHRSCHTNRLRPITIRGGRTIPDDMARHLTCPFEYRPQRRSERHDLGGSCREPEQRQPATTAVALRCCRHHATFLIWRLAR